MIKNYIFDKNLENYLKDKRVVVVGPSIHLMGRGLGPMIENYDVVCRLNEVSVIGLEKDYGFRTDIAFINCATISIGDYVYKMREAGEIAENIKYMVCPVIKVQHDGGGNVFDNAAMINVYDIPFVHIGVKNYQNIYSEYGIEPNSGQVSIVMLLQYPIKELFVTGISFYTQETNESNNYERYYHKTHTPEFLQVKQFNPRVGHQQLPQMRYFRNVLLRDYKDKLKIDSYLKEVLQIEYENVVKL